jgi:hypothetical protein
LALAWACRLEVTYDGSHFSCDDGVCPPGYDCISAMCERSGLRVVADANLDTDAPFLADAPPGAPDAFKPMLDATPPGPDASTVCLLSGVKDDFADPARAKMWNEYETPPTVVSEVGGVMVIDIPAGRSGENYAGYVSSNGDARGQRISIKLVQTPSAATASQTFFKVENPTDYNQAASFLIENGTVRYSSEGPGLDGKGVSVSGTMAYNPETHVYLGIRELNGVVTFETSTDGINWSGKGTAPVPLSFASVRMSIGGGSWKAEPQSTQAKWDNVNGGGVPSGCPY